VSNETERRIYAVLRALYRANSPAPTRYIAENAGYTTKKGSFEPAVIEEVRRILRELEKVGAVLSWYEGTEKMWGTPEAVRQWELRGAELLATEKAIQRQQIGESAEVPGEEGKG
jgi:hypothetical protein